MLLSPLSDLIHLANESLTARKDPIELFEDQGTAIDIRISLPENDMAYFYSVDLEILGEDNYRASIGLVIYDENPFGRVSKNALDFKIEKEDGFYLPAGGSTMGYGIHHKNISVDVDFGQDSIELFYIHSGSNIRVDIPLSWEAV